MSDPRCKCTMAQSMVGDGCRYCQPQEYIDRLHDHMAEDENDWKNERAGLVKALRELAEAFPPTASEEEFDALEKACTLLAQLDAVGKTDASCYPNQSNPRGS